MYEACHAGMQCMVAGDLTAVHGCLLIREEERSSPSLATLKPVCSQDRASVSKQGPCWQVSGQLVAPAGPALPELKDMKSRMTGMHVPGDHWT